jgi:competence ComEA-like helix-hairpin-helix protein
MNARDLLLVMMVASVPFVGAPRWPASTGPPGPRRDCPVVVEAGPIGCVSEEEAARARVRAGDRLALDGGRLVRGRMAPARLAAFGVAVDVNHATVEELASLDGIGPKLAERLVAARPFRSLDEVARVRGIGAHRLARLRPRLLLALDD